MTEYWKSQARKYCEFCKCWFADNKVSISFHENGKRHKESVEKHISSLSKRSAKEFKAQGKVDDEMRKMEAAAMAAYAKDVQNNADLTSQCINEMLGHSSKDEPAVVTSKSAPKPPPAWHEVKNDDGTSYYWNTLNNETTWDPPDEFVSVAEQEENKLKEQQEKKKKEQTKKQKEKEEAAAKKQELKAFMAREKMKEKAVKSDPSPSTVKEMPTFGPAPRTDKPYGKWTTVAHEPSQELDLQLPKLKELPPPPVIVQPELIQFGEKRIDSLGEGPVEFKKRKVNNPKRNMRQKLDED